MTFAEHQYLELTHHILFIHPCSEMIWIDVCLSCSHVINMQGLHEVAYTGGLSKPMICPEGALGNLTADRLAEFVQRNYTASRMVLSGAGVQQVPSSAALYSLHAVVTKPVLGIP